jgi:hypothetical protein
LMTVIVLGVYKRVLAATHSMSAEWSRWTMCLNQAALKAVVVTPSDPNSVVTCTPAL